VRLRLCMLMHMNLVEAGIDATHDVTKFFVVLSRGALVGM
jgi:hypothetical protein